MRNNVKRPVRIFDILLILIASITVATKSFAKSTEEKIASSGSARVNVLELFSSEGCSSCPPADKWVSELKTSEDLFKKFIPIVFHVDYWNDIGWKDGFSSNLMTRRQQEIANTWSKPAVYTPGFVFNGKEWREHDVSALSKSSPSPYSITLFKLSDGGFVAKVSGLKKAKASQTYNLKIAKLGMGLETDVATGENAGEHLTHNFLVLDWSSKSIDATRPQAAFKLEMPSKGAKKTAVVVWLETSGDPTPVQATGAFL
ncbi:hypothetical protein BH10BDE1_BH10BDE1_09450 [soil metagenome]